jgi:NAD/NADP transhydrogenase beta subunit
MTVFYGVVLLVGLILAGVWLVMVAIAGQVDGWEHVDPELRWGIRGRSVVAGLIGFGMAGISVLYTQLPDLFALAGGFVGAAALIAVSRYFGPSPAS